MLALEIESKLFFLKNQIWHLGIIKIRICDLISKDLAHPAL